MQALPLLGHSSWDTRVAAANLVRLIARTVDAAVLLADERAAAAADVDLDVPPVSALLERPDVLLGSGHLQDVSAKSMAAAEPVAKRSKPASSRQLNAQARKERNQLRTSQATMGPGGREKAAGAACCSICAARRPASVGKRGTARR